MVFKRRIPIKGQEYTLLSGLSTYAHKVNFAGEALEFLEQAHTDGTISENVYQVAKIIVTGDIPPDASLEVQETANYYLQIAKSYQPTQAA